MLLKHYNKILFIRQVLLYTFYIIYMSVQHSASLLRNSHNFSVPPSAKPAPEIPQRRFHCITMLKYYMFYTSCSSSYFLLESATITVCTIAMISITIVYLSTNAVGRVISSVRMNAIREIIATGRLIIRNMPFFFCFFFSSSSSFFVFTN